MLSGDIGNRSGRTVRFVVCVMKRGIRDTTRSARAQDPRENLTPLQTMTRTQDWEDAQAAARVTLFMTASTVASDVRLEHISSGEGRGNVVVPVA